MKNTEFSTIDQKVFADIELKNCYSFYDLKNQKIKKEIYFSPMMYPYVHYNDWRLGSVFENFYLPSGSYNFDDDFGWQKIVPNLHIQDYEDFLYSEIKKNILEQYAKNKQVNLLFSAGIDSLVVASFVISMGLENKTRFITMYDHNQTNQYAIVHDEKLRHRIENFFKRFSRCQDWVQIEWSTEDFVNVCNKKDYEQLRVHSTSALFDRYKDEIFIGGHGGNWSMLHWHAQIDEMLMHNPAVANDLERIFNLENIYCVTNKSDYVNKHVPMAEKHYIKKRWDLLDGINGNELPNIVSSDQIFDQTRKLDWTTWTDPYEISNACISRRIIEKNVGDLFDETIGNESLDDSDTFVSKNLPYEALDSSIFETPDNLNHNLNGLIYFKQELVKAKNTGYLNTNTVASMLAVQDISNKLNTKCANT